ncbi:MAG: hypothetical protein JF609_08090 [Verrucomicrobia bacterium]|nr:hypothetical protein [Verrucomicrobiota bacterium]
MKNAALILLLATSIALGVLAFHLQKQSAQTQTELARVQNQLAEVQNQLKAAADATDQVATARHSSKVLQDSLTETSRFADEKAKQAEQLQQALADAKTNSPKNPLAGMAKMFSDPKMKEMMKTQQKAVMGPMIEKQYGALFQQLNLTADQSAQLKTMLLNKMLAGADAGMSMMDDSLDADKRAELAKEVKTATDAGEAEIKQFLGDSYPAYQTYEKTVPDRQVVNQFGDQLSGNDALSADQQAQLTQALNEARTGFKWSTDYTDKNPPNGDYAAMFSQEKIDQFTQEKEQFDQQFLEQAQKILSPSQATQFKDFQTTQRQMQLMGMKMAARMFGQKNQ